MGSVEVRKIQKSFGATKVIHEMDLAIAASEFLVLVGPSGCGKSTLLRMIAGLEAPTSGEVLIDGAVVNDLSPKERGVAMVFQNYALYPHMTVRQNMAFSLKLSKLPPAEIDRRVDEAAKILGIEEQLAKKPGQLSGGQKQRVAMGRAMVRQPKLFLFDEPLSNLDAQLRVKMRAEISLLHRRIRSTVIYVTHDQVEAMTLADRIAVLHQGRIEQIGTPLELYSNPRTKFVAGFIGTPAMNFLPSKKAGTRWIGVRPEHTTLGGVGQTLLRGKVQLVEPLGGLSHVHVFDGKNTLVVETRDVTPALDSDATVMAPPERLYYFDEMERRV